MAERDRGGFQGQRQWTDWLPNADFTEAISNSTFDWNGKRQPRVFATENDTLNGATMLIAHLVTNMAPLFSDVRTYWSPEAVERVVGRKPTGRAANGFIHLTIPALLPLMQPALQRMRTETAA